MITLEISEAYQSQIETAPIENAAQTAMQQQAAPTNAELTIVITGDDQIRELNQQYRDIDAPTDVLSFPADFTDPENDNPYLGDIIISFPYAEAQAASAGHSTTAELQLLVTHGVLHLLGHDHADPKDKAEMWAAQSEILDQLGLEDLQISGDQ